MVHYYIRDWARLFLALLAVCSGAAYSSDYYLSSNGATGAGVYLRVGRQWYVASGSKFKFNRIEALDKFLWLRPMAETCGITDDYQAGCWGRELLSGEIHPTQPFGKVPSDTTQYEAYCLTTAKQEVYCLSDTTYEKVDTTGLGGNVTALSGSADHACALTENGQVYCWGVNFKGRLGIGGMPFIQLPEDDTDWSVATSSPPIPFPTLPIQGVNGVRFKQVSVFGNTSCALSDEPSDNAYCWGRLSDYEGTVHRFDWISRTTSSSPRRISLSAVADGKLEGLVAGPLWGAGWDAENTVYWWGSFEDSPLADSLALKVSRLDSIPRANRIRTMVPAQGQLCVLTTLGVGVDEKIELFCTMHKGMNETSRRFRRVFPE